MLLCNSFTISIVGIFCVLSSLSYCHDRHDLVDIRLVNPRIIIDLKYATIDNFTHAQVYSQAKCFARKATANKLNSVQQDLEEMGLGLKIFDAYRPRKIQYKFWELVHDESYVANPTKGSSHNRGAAVDVTLVDKQGRELLMPTEFDNFTAKAHRTYMELPEEAIKNRALLEKVMTKHGFIGLPTEWWHFDDADWQQYDLLDIPFEELP